MYKIGVIGDRDSVMGFQVLGLDTFPVTDADETRRLIHKLAKEDYAILYLTEHIAAQIPQELERYKDQLTPAIILIPSKEGSLGLGMANVSRTVERAIGADIL